MLELELNFLGYRRHPGSELRVLGGQIHSECPCPRPELINIMNAQETPVHGNTTEVGFIGLYKPFFRMLVAKAMGFAIRGN